MSENVRCAECGMETKPGEYHPYAACLMFKASHSSDVVRANLGAVIEHGEKRAEYVIDLLSLLGM